MKLVRETIGHRLGGAQAETMYQRSKIAKSKHNSAALKFCDEFNPEKENGYIFGPVGSGKTHMATTVAITHFGRVVKPYQIFRAARIAMTDNELHEADVIELFAGRKISTSREYIGPVTMLVLDDLGTEKLTEWNESILFEIIDRRIMDGINGLIVTSNLPLDSLAERLQSDRIVSRLAGLCKVLSLGAEFDHRLNHDRKAS